MIGKYSVLALNRLSKQKEIYCFGCGKRLHEMLELYRDEPFTRRITTLIDNNITLHGERIQVGEHQIKIESPQVLKSVDINKVLILITSDRKNEIYRFIIDKFKLTEIQCGEYPTYYYGYSRMFMWLFCRTPLQRKILFNAGNQPHENADAIVNYLNKEYQGKPYRMIYMVDNMEVDVQQGITKMDRNVIRKKNSLLNNLKYCFNYATAKYILYEDEPLFKVRKNQISIYLNHGTIPLKKVKDVLKQPDEIDYGMCPAEECADIYEEQYGIPREKHIYIMQPRIQTMFLHKGELHKVIKYTNEQIIIWLPTFRALKGTNRMDSKSDNLWNMLEGDMNDEIQKILKENNQVLLIKQHPRDKNIVSRKLENSNIRVITDQMLEEQKLSLHSILNDTDAMITDYSGIAFEYLLLNRPIAYAISDIEDYTRGFSVNYPLDYMPGIKIHDKKEFLFFLETIKNKSDMYEAQRKELTKRLFGVKEYQNGAKELIEKFDTWERRSKACTK